MTRFDDDDELDEDPVDADDEEEPTVPCPACGRDIYEDADACPYCGEYLSFDDPTGNAKPWWFWLGLFACLAVMLSGVIVSLMFLFG